MSDDQSNYPIRINKYLALRGYSTRRGADELIAAGKVTINEKTAALGDKVSERDTVEVAGAREKSSYTYLAYYKPRGTVTHGAQQGEIDIAAQLKKKPNTSDVFPVGRLDKNSHGLILLTDDGRIVEPLLSPERTHEKEYVVTVNERLRSDFADTMAAGVDIGGYVTKPCTVERLTKNTFRITLTEGKHHQIKRMCDALRYTVRDLKRTRIMNISLGRLRPNTYRVLRAPERTALLTSLGVGHS